MNGDINDTMRREGAAGVRIRHDKARRFDGAIGQDAMGRLRDVGDKPPDALALTFYNDITEPTPKPWLIKNVIARGETSSWIAPPGRGKSALLTDMSVHLAAGSDWRGYRTRGRSGVAIFALERADLTKRRLVAYRLRDSLDNLPIVVVGEIIDLMNKSCVDIIVDALKRAEVRFGCQIGLAIFDTYAKGIAAGGGDENQAKDQNIAVANLQRVIDRTGIHIATIGHTGKDEKKGERGSNAKLGHVDVEAQIKGDAVKTVIVNKANDQPEGALTSFRLEPYEFGKDDDGDPFRTFIVSKDVLTGDASDRKLSDKQQLAVDALVEVLLGPAAQPAPAEYGLPVNIKVVTEDEWMTELCRQGVLDPAASNKRARYTELRNALKRRKVIGARDNLVWK
jgi:hypothetical protein